MTAALFGGVGACAVALAAYEPSRNALTEYVQLQVLSSLRGERETNADPLATVRHLGLGVAARMAIVCGVFWMFGRGAGRPRWSTAMLFFSIALSASLPIAVSPKLAGHYFRAVGAVLRARLRVPGGRAGVEAPRPCARVAPTRSGASWSRAAHRQRRRSDPSRIGRAAGRRPDSESGCRGNGGSARRHHRHMPRVGLGAAQLREPLLPCVDGCGWCSGQRLAARRA